MTSGDEVLWEKIKGYVSLNPAVLVIGGGSEFFRDILKPSRFETINPDSKSSYRCDLNYSVTHLFPYREFHVIINTGASALVFNQYQLFKTIHDCCRYGGLMVHTVLWTGWLDSAYYTYQPGFFRDLAEANEYETVTMFAYEVRGQTVRWACTPSLLGEDTLLYTAFQKTTVEPFRIPAQKP